MAKHRDPLLPPDGDYPTGPIDVWPLLAEDAPADAFAVKDVRGQVHLHGKGSGRFVKRPTTRPTVDRMVGNRPMRLRVFTWAEVQANPEMADGPNVFEYPDEPGVEWETTVIGGGVATSCKPAGQVTAFKVTPPKRDRPILPEASVIRAWAQRNGIPVSASGKLSKAVTDAYMAARQQA